MFLFDLDNIHCDLAFQWNLLKTNSKVAAETVTHLGRGGWAYCWRCVHLSRLLLYESTCSPSLWTISNLTAAIFSAGCFLHTSEAKMVSSAPREIQLDWLVWVKNFLFVIWAIHRTCNLVPCLYFNNMCKNVWSQWCLVVSIFRSFLLIFLLLRGNVLLCEKRL